MDALTSASPEADGRGIEFTGNWREYLPIAITNALLIICTLGVYRFWAAARQRRYLWSRTRFIDDSLEWTGTGKEMFFGFLLVMCVLVPFFLFFQFLFPALVARGKAEAAGGIFFLFYIALIYLGGFARFRALRYRLSRTFWHGIRGGSDDPGWNYGGEYLGRIFLAGVTMWIAWPWMAVHLWNARWNKMSFGPLQFEAGLEPDGLKRRWALIYAAVGIFFIGVILVGIMSAGSSAQSETGKMSPTIGVVVVAIFLLFYLAIPLATLHWYAKYFRHASEATKIGDLEFSFDAKTLQWLGLFLGNLGLAVVTLGFGLTYWGYRNWAFMIRHLHVYGTVDLSDLTQSTTHAPREAEGFADAFDVGAV